jgi:hypothetical protein
MARPKQTTIRDRHVTFRVTAEELYRLTVKAVKSGKSLSEFARTKVIAARSRRPARAADDAGSLVAIDHALFDELRRQGVNLNQIARHCNTQQVPPPPSLEPLLREIRDLLDRGMAGRDP